MEQEVKDYIDAEIEKVIEKVLLLLPDTWASLINEHTAVTKATKAFYESNPELKNHRDTVQKVLAEVDSMHPTLSLDKKINDALPLIKERLKDLRKFNVTDINRSPELNLPDIRPSNNNGAI